MYIINVLVPFDVLIDIDMGLLKLIEFDYHNEDFFLPGILNTSETNQKYFLITRTSSNIVESLLTVEDKELAEDLYNQFMEKEYDNIFVILISLSIVFVLINMYNYNNLAIQNQITQKKDEIYLSKINECIVKYEKENNIKITKVVFKKEIPYYDTYNGYDSNIFTCKGIVANYSNIWCLNYYTGRNLEKINDNETFNKLFSSDKINYQEFNEKQIKFLDETVYIRIY